MAKPHKAGKVIPGPWPENSLGEALKPEQRAGRYLPPSHRCRVLSTRYDHEREDWPCRSRYLEFEQPVLQFNLPFPDMPTLGQIARNRSLRSFEPFMIPNPRWPPLIRRCVLNFILSHFYRIEPAQLLQDPDWYENLPVDLSSP